MLRKTLIASAAALPLLAGIGATNEAHAQAGAPWYGQASFVDAVVVPGIAVAAVGGTFLHMLLNANVKDGSLRAAVPTDPAEYAKVALAPRGGAKGRSYEHAFVSISGAEVASAAK